MSKHSPTLIGAVLLVCLLAGCANAPATAEKPVPEPAVAITEKGPFPVLKVGMTGEVIRTKLGNPVETRPMESPIGKAEVWVYNIERTVDTTQVVTGTRDIPAFTIGMTGPTTVNVPEPVYSMADKKQDITLSLLMLNGRLIAQTSSVRDYIQYK